METLDARQRRLAGLARSVRAAVVLPSLFALALFVVGQPEVAGFTIFGTFAHLVMVNYDRAWRARSAESAMLTGLGAIVVSLGTLASANVWLAVSGAIVAGFLTEFSMVAAGRIAVIRTALLLAFMLAVAIPSPVRSVRPNLEGWLLSGIVAQPALLLLWIRLENVDVAGNDGALHESIPKPVRPSSPSTWIGNAAGAGMAMGLAVLLTRLMKVEHAFWVVLGVLPVLNVTQTSATRTFWKEQAGTLIGFLVGVSLVAVIGAHQAWYWLILPVIIFAAAYAANAVGFISGQAGFTVFTVVLFCILLPQQKDVGIRRVEDIALGGAVSLVVSLVRRAGERR
jgi:Fusaric acid resistance protein-like